MLIFYNPNPDNQFVGDCVIRAVSVVTGQNWETTYDDICAVGREGMGASICIEEGFTDILCGILALIVIRFKTFAETIRTALIFLRHTDTL